MGLVPVLVDAEISTGPYNPDTAPPQEQECLSIWAMLRSGTAALSLSTKSVFIEAALAAAINILYRPAVNYY